MNSLRGKRILVTGATGFIGGRVVERLILEQGAEVVALVHHFQNASRLARFPLRMVAGDVTDSALVMKAAEGCDAIVHAAVTFSGTAQHNRQVTVEGARHVCEAAKARGIRRVVHFSTFSVYGQTGPGRLAEDGPHRVGGDAYGRSKWEAERLVQQYQRQGLPATILQPSIVYGPWSFWSGHPVRQLLAGEVALPEGGNGLCNAVYVDDVVEAVFLSLQRESAAPGPFLISGAAPVTWRDYYLAHAAALPGASVSAMTEAELAFLTGKSLTAKVDRLFPPPLRRHLKGFCRELPGMQTFLDRAPFARRAYRDMTRVLGFKRADEPGPIGGASPPPRPRLMPEREHLSLLCSKTEIQIDRARTELHYQPKYDLARGGALTTQWLRWAGYGLDRL